MDARVKGAAISAAGAAGAAGGFLWFGHDPLAGLSVALWGAVALGWGAHRAVFGRIR
jgi:hypothetical protein